MFLLNVANFQIYDRPNLHTLYFNATHAHIELLSYELDRLIIYTVLNFTANGIVSQGLKSYQNKIQIWKHVNHIQSNQRVFIYYLGYRAYENTFHRVCNGYLCSDVISYQYNHNESFGVNHRLKCIHFTLRCTREYYENTSVG